VTLLNDYIFGIAVAPMFVNIVLRYKTLNSIIQKRHQHATIKTKKSKKAYSFLRSQFTRGL
jgi:hypothetical protein